MDVLLSIIIGIILTVIIDKHFQLTAKVAFAVLNFTLITFMIFSSNDPTVAKIVSEVIEKSSYEILHDALIHRETISLISYSAYDLLCLLVLIGVLVLVFDISHVSSKHFYKALYELIDLIKSRKFKVNELNTEYEVTCDELYNQKTKEVYFLRC